MFSDRRHSILLVLMSNEWKRSCAAAYWGVYLGVDIKCGQEGREES